MNYLLMPLLKVTECPRCKRVAFTIRCRECGYEDPAIAKHMKEFEEWMKQPHIQEEMKKKVEELRKKKNEE